MRSRDISSPRLCRFKLNYLRGCPLPGPAYITCPIGVGRRDGGAHVMVTTSRNSYPSRLELSVFLLSFVWAVRLVPPPSDMLLIRVAAAISLWSREPLPQGLSTRQIIVSENHIDTVEIIGGSVVSCNTNIRAIARDYGNNTPGSLWYYRRGIKSWR